jgi:hypothetical protein
MPWTAVAAYMMMSWRRSPRVAAHTVGRSVFTIKVAVCITCELHASLAGNVIATIPQLI